MVLVTAEGPLARGSCAQQGQGHHPPAPFHVPHLRAAGMRHFLAQIRSSWVLWLQRFVSCNRNDHGRDFLWKPLLLAKSYVPETVSAIRTQLLSWLSIPWETGLHLQINLLLFVFYIYQSTSPRQDSLTSVPMSLTFCLPNS